MERYKDATGQNDSEHENEIKDKHNDKSSRRDFLKKLGIVAGAATLGGGLLKAAEKITGTAKEIHNKEELRSHLENPQLSLEQAPDWIPQVEISANARATMNQGELSSIRFPVDEEFNSIKNSEFSILETTIDFSLHSRAEEEARGIKDPLRRKYFYSFLALWYGRMLNATMTVKGASRFNPEFDFHRFGYEYPTDGEPNSPGTVTKEQSDFKPLSSNDRDLKYTALADPPKYPIANEVHLFHSLTGKRVSSNLSPSEKPEQLVFVDIQERSLPGIRPDDLIKAGFIKKEEHLLLLDNQNKSRKDLFYATFSRWLAERPAQENRTAYLKHETNNTTIERLSLSMAGLYVTELDVSREHPNSVHIVYYEKK